MTGHRPRIISGWLACLAGVLLGVWGTSLLRAGEPTLQPGSGRRVIRPDKAPNTGLPFSPGIRVGNTVYVAGHLGRDPVTSKLVPGGIEGETRQAINNIREVLRTAGMDLNDVASVTVYITSFADFARFNAVYREFFPADPPARATVQVAALNDGARVELQMIAARP
jgi:2-iminobutanoate/2-iminopropanoate deaminase